MAVETSDQPTDDRARLLAHFEGDTADHQSRWSKLWDKGDFLPWDKGAPNPALIDLLASKDRVSIGAAIEEHGGNGQQRRKKALVPGCGRGYDVLLFASFGFDAYGLEVSESAVKRCIQEQETNIHKYPVHNDSIGAGKVQFLNGDFFGDAWALEVGLDGFDVIYDYTFLSALPPPVRPAWALRMKKLLSAKGFLVCVEFPTYKDPSTGGPPYALPPQVYLEHLSHPGKEIPYDEDGHVRIDYVPGKDAEALRRIAHYQPSRTHEIGKGTDWVSIWQHL